MKLLSFERAGKAGWGVALESGIIDGAALFDGRFASLRAVLEAGALDEVKRAIIGRKADFGFDAIKYLPVIPNPDKIVCAGVNYDAHRIESGRERTENPMLFLRVAQSQLGHEQTIMLPPESDKLDYEGEIAIIIGKTARRVSEADSWSHIAGYAPYNDATIRDWQRHTAQFTPGKNFEATGGFGPWMTTRDEIADGEELTLETRLNGEVMQHATTALMICSIPALISYISVFTTLVPGDVIVTGTPGGVGFKRTPPVYMKHGDVVEIEVSKVGILRNTIAAEVR